MSEEVETGVAKTPWTDEGHTIDQPDDDLPDAEIARRMRAGAAIAERAAQVFRRRHLPAASAYARLCTNNGYAALQLASEALDAVVREATEGIDPLGTWRHRAMVIVQRIAGTWLTHGARAQLDPAFIDWLQGAGAEVPDPTAPEVPSDPRDVAILRGYYSLTERMRAILWYSLVEREPDDNVATWLGITADEVEGLRDRSMEAMRQAFLHTYLRTQGDGSCLGFQRIIESAARPDSTRYNEDFIHHLEHCPTCALALSELTRMWERPRTALAEGLLRWGASYVVDDAPGHDLAAATLTDACTTAPPSRTSIVDLFNQPSSHSPAHRQDDSRQRRPGRALLPSVLVATLAVIGAGLPLAQLSASHTGRTSSGRHVVVPVATHPVATLTPTVTAPAVTLTPTVTAHPATLTPAAAAPTSASAVPTTTTPAPSVGGGNVVNATGEIHAIGSGECLDVPNVSTSPGTPLQIWGCNGGANQMWTFTDSHQLTVYSGEYRLCLDAHDRETGPGTRVRTWYCNGHSSEQWLLNPDGTITGAQSGLCLDVARGSTDDGTLLELWPCDGGNQRWAVYQP